MTHSFNITQSKQLQKGWRRPSEAEMNGVTERERERERGGVKEKGSERRRRTEKTEDHKRASCL